MPQRLQNLLLKVSIHYCPFRKDVTIDFGWQSHTRRCKRMCFTRAIFVPKARVYHPLGGMSLELRHALRNFPRRDTTQADIIMCKRTASHQVNRTKSKS